MVCGCRPSTSFRWNSLEIVSRAEQYGSVSRPAPSIHTMKACHPHRAESHLVRTEKQNEDLVQSLSKDFEDDPVRLWEPNIFGKESLTELVNDGLQNKLLHMPQEAGVVCRGDAGTGHQRGLY